MFVYLESIIIISIVFKKSIFAVLIENIIFIQKISLTLLHIYSLSQNFLLGKGKQKSLTLLCSQFSE